MSEISVSGLFTYPIKSCAGTRLEKAEVTELGLQFDRRFMLVDYESGHPAMVTQRKDHLLATAQPRILEADDEGNIAMEVSASGHGKVDFVYMPGEERGHSMTLLDVHGQGVVVAYADPEQAKEINGFFSSLLRKEVEIAAVPDPRYHNPPSEWPAKREVKQQYQSAAATNITGFADAFPILLTSMASIIELDRVANEDFGAGRVHAMNRFRPNVVVSGDELDPYDEDFWRIVKIGGMTAYVAKPCDRCPIPFVDQEFGQLDASKTLGAALAKTRRGRNVADPDDKGNKVYFGQNLNHVYEEGLVLSEGDKVEVVSRSDVRNVELRQAA